MNGRWPTAIVLMILTGVAAAGLVWWHTAPPPAPIVRRVPGMERELTPRVAPAELPPIEGSLERRTAALPPDIPGNWPQFRGPERDGVARPDTALNWDWPADGPPRRWEIEVGEGYAAPAVRDGRVYLMDYDREAERDVLRCLSLADGSELWAYSWPLKVKRNHGMSRTVPAVVGPYVVAMGPKCHVACVNAETGEPYWLLDLVREWGTTVPQWYAGQCPLISDGAAILAPGGRALLMAVDCETGEVRWQTPNPQNWQMSHASIMPMRLGERDTWVYVADGGVLGVDAATGEPLWETTEWRIKIATVPTPVILPDERIFLCGGYGSGAMMLRLQREDDRIVPVSEWSVRPVVFGSAQQTPIWFRQHLFGVRPSGEMVCLQPDGKVAWASGPTHRFGLGPYLVIGDKLVVMDDHGVLTVLAADPGGYRELASAEIWPDGREAWGPPARAGRYLLVRDFTRLACLDIGLE